MAHHFYVDVRGDLEDDNRSLRAQLAYCRGRIAELETQVKVLRASQTTLRFKLDDALDKLQGL